MAAQLAPLATVGSMPYFFKISFSWAMTIGEQSVSAIMPNFILVVSGASLAKTDPVQRLGRPANSAAVAERARKFRRVKREIFLLGIVLASLSQLAMRVI